MAMSSSDVTRLLGVCGEWGTWAAWCSPCPSSACSTMSALPQLWNSLVLGSASLVWMWFSVTWHSSLLETFVPSWCFDGWPLRRSALSIMCTRIFVFATRLRARWDSSYSPGLILWHLPREGSRTDIHSLIPCFYRRGQTAGSGNEQSWQRVSMSKDFEIWLFEWTVGMQMWPRCCDAIQTCKCLVLCSCKCLFWVEQDEGESTNLFS